MTKSTLSREEIREQVKEDELGEFIKRATEFGRKHRRSLTVALVALIVIVAAWKLVQYREIKAVENSNLQFNQAQQNYSQAVFSFGIEPAERARLLDQSIQTSDLIRQSFSGTPAARMAFYLQGNAWLARRDEAGSTESAEKAKEVFRQYADTADSKEDKARGLLGLAAAYQNIGFQKNDPSQYDKSRQIYREIIGLLPKTSYLVLEAKLSLARLLAGQGDTAQAAALFREIIDTAGKTQYKEPEEPAVTAAERQRRQFDKNVREILDRFTYSQVAQQELNTIVPPSAKALDLQVPGLPTSETGKAGEGAR